MSDAATRNHARDQRISRRAFVAGAAATACSLAGLPARASARDPLKRPSKQALIAITLDLEMSRHYPRREMTEWDYRKGDLDEATKEYSLGAAKIARELGGLIHFFCVGRVLEQPDISWLQEIAAAGHPIGNHTYDHVYVLAKTPEECQFRFQRSPWLVRDRTSREVIEENIRLTEIALQQRAGVTQNGFRTPGGFATGLEGREDVQQMLLALGFPWVSSKYPAHDAGTPKSEPTADVYDSIVRAQAAAQPFVYESGLIEIPMSPISDVNAFRSNYWKLEWFLKAIELGVEWAIENGGVFDFLAHPSCLVVEDPEFHSIRLICELVKRAGDRAKIVGLDEIARQFT